MHTFNQLPGNHKIYSKSTISDCKLISVLPSLISYMPYKLVATRMSISNGQQQNRHPPNCLNLLSPQKFSQRTGCNHFFNISRRKQKKLQSGWPEKTVIQKATQETLTTAESNFASGPTLLMVEPGYIKLIMGVQVVNPH
jgi:hypothetical protein